MLQERGKHMLAFQNRKGMLLVALVLLAVLVASVTGFAPKAMADASEDGANADGAELEFPSVAELAGKRIGVVNGSTFDKLVLENVKGVSQDDIYYFSNNPETIGALEAGKVDAIINDSPLAQLAVNKNDGIGLLPDYIVDDSYGYVLEKGSDLTPKINERLKVYREDGTIGRLREKWTDPDESKQTMSDIPRDGPNGTIVVATSVDNEPINYLKDDRMHGMCIELLEMIARDLGYGIEYRTTNGGSLIAEVQSGKADIAANSFSITDERKKMVDMTEPYYEGGVAVIVRTVGGSQAEQGFLEGLAASFERTFIVEDRWKLILGGLGVTLLISVASGAAGLLLGFLFVLARRKKEGGIADKLIRILESLAGGLPVIVVLMLFYYVIFGSIDAPGVAVAIIAFTLLFAASTGSIMWNAIRAVDPGQAEAGRSLGFSDRETFFLVVLPQAARTFVSLLIGQFVSLIKETAVVGYIAVQDLTRVGDLIRARTMEAFFPLIAVAIIYFVFCRLAAWLLGKLAKKLEPKDEPRTIEGVDLQ